MTGKTGKEREIAVFPVTERGMALAERLLGLCGRVRVHAPADLRGGRMKGRVREAFRTGDALVFIGASGIAVRAVAPILKGKERDPAVVVMDERGRFAVSLLSGHLGGANRLAREVAALTGAEPVVTTATDVNDLPCIEDLALGFNLAIENHGAIKALNTAILRGGPVFVIDSNRERLRAMQGSMDKRVKGVFFFRRTPPASAKAGAAAIITPRLKVALPAGLRPRALILRPREFVVGIGCRRGVGAAEIKRAVDRALRERGMSPLAIRNLATIDLKASEEGLVEFAGSRGLGVDFFTAGELDKRAIRKSAFVMAATGARAVSEPAALLSSGAKRLWMKKKKSPRVTVAVARAGFTS